MHGAPPALFEALEALHADVSRRLEAARLLAAGLLASGRANQRVSPIADRQRRTRLTEAATEASVLREVVEELEEILGEFEERRRADNGPDHRGLSTPRVGEDAQSPEPF